MASMGIYLFSRESLKRALESDSTDFGGHIIPASIGAGGTYGYAFQGYWEDVGTISTFYNANVALCGGRPATQGKDQLAMQVGQRATAHGHVVDFGRLQPGVVEQVTDRLAGESRPVLDPLEALLLDGADELPLDQQRCR
jgi:hypothetical protein